MIQKYLKSIVTMLIPLLIGVILITILSYFDIMSTKVVNYTKIIIPILSILLGGIYIGQRSKEKGWLEGIKVGLLFLILFFIFSYLAFQEGMHLRTWLYYLILLISSMLGSMIGINKRKV